jgi:hypothetical protein
MKPLGKVKIEWSQNFAYMIGLMASDGNLSSDGRHINFTSKDYDLAFTYKTILGIDNVIGRKTRAQEKEKKYFFVQFGDVLFYRFLVSIGLTPQKSKTIGKLDIPNQFFFDFLRGCIDGDGNIQTFKHPESKHLQLRVRLVSASRPFLEWIHQEIMKYDIKGYMQIEKTVFCLTFAMGASKKLLSKIYYKGFKYCLIRKYLLAKEYLIKE